MVGMGGFGHSVRYRLFVYQQLAAGAAGRKSSYGECSALKCSVPDSPVGRQRLLFAAFGRWNFLGWHGIAQKTLRFRASGAVALTPAQRVCGWFFFVMAVSFLLQTLVGAALQHYRA